MPLSRIQTTLISGDISDSVLRTLLVPSVPTSVTVVSGNSQALVTWTAPTIVVPPVTDYVVQYSSNSGSTWTTFGDGTSTATSATVTGLTNGTSYVFRVACVNAVGTSAYSAVSSGVIIGSDPFFSNVALLLPMNGTGNTFVDVSPAPKTITAVGNVTQSAAQSKWGGKSAFFDGNGSRLTMPDAAVFYFGSGDYTVEAWLYITTLNTQGGGNFFSQSAQISNNNNRQHAFAVNSTGLVVYWTTNGVSDNSSTFATALPTNQWIHVAFARQGGMLRAYLNGTQVGDALSHDVTYFNSSANVCVGSFGSYADDGYAFLDYIGYIDDLRITQNLARYTGATFSVPIAAFPTS